METRMQKRLQKDYEQMLKNYKDTFTVTLVNNEIRHWIVRFNAAEGTVYSGETFE
jgi:ubiquitin-protein ligase